MQEHQDELLVGSTSHGVDILTNEHPVNDQKDLLELGGGDAFDEPYVKKEEPANYHVEDAFD